MMRVIFWVLAWLAGGTLALTPALLVYWYNEGAPVVYAQRQLLTPNVAPGDELQIQITSELKKSCVASVRRYITDATGATTEFAPVKRPAFASYTVKLIVPQSAAPGPALYGARAEWECNPLQKWFPNEVVQPDIPFMILSKQGNLP